MTRTLLHSPLPSLLCFILLIPSCIALSDTDTSADQDEYIELELDVETPTLDSTYKSMYEAYPYPPIDVPLQRIHDVVDSLAHAFNNMDSEESEELDGIDLSHILNLPTSTPLLRSPSHLTELNHYLYRGRRNFCISPFRILFAGGGTGEKMVQLASQLEDMHVNYEILHLELSSKSIQAAKQKLTSYRPHALSPLSATRASKRLAAHIRFVQGSILDIPNLNLGQFDYIDCIGVLHLFPNPLPYIQALVQSLLPTGGMALMMYGAIGKQAIYDIRRMIQMVQDVEAVVNGDTLPERIDTVKRLLATLPPTHSLRTDPFKWRALQRYLHRTGDIGLVDLFLTAYEKPYRIDDIFDLLDHARLKLVTFVPPCTYDVRQYVTDPVLLSKIESLPLQQQLAFTELLFSGMTHHTFYVTHAHAPTSTSLFTPPLAATPTGIGPSRPITHMDHATVAKADDGEFLIPIPFNMSPSHLATYCDRHPSQPLPFTHANYTYTSHTPLTSIQCHCLKYVDGVRTIHEIVERTFADLSLVDPSLSVDMTFESIQHEFNQLFHVLNSFGRLYLSSTPLLHNEKQIVGAENAYRYTTLQACKRRM